MSGLKLRANVTSKAKAKALQKLQQELEMVGDEDEDEVQALPAAPVDDPEEQITQFAIRTENVEDVRNECRRLNYPLLEEYDFRHDHVCEGEMRDSQIYSPTIHPSFLIPHDTASALPLMPSFCQTELDLPERNQPQVGYSSATNHERASAPGEGASKPFRRGPGEERK